MADASPYSQLDNEALCNPSGLGDYKESPPPYTDTAMTPVKDGFQSPPPGGAYPLPAFPSAPSGGVYPPQPQPMVPAPQVVAVPVAVPQPAPAVTQVVVGGHLAPGTCTVCRRGKIEDSASCCTWFWCLVLLPLGILPGLLAFCCCCRRPKCTHCGFSI